MNSAILVTSPNVLQGNWSITCRDPDGQIKWIDTWTNLVVNEGLNYALNVSLHTTPKINTFYLLLTDGTPTPASTDTLSSHPGWVEVSAYSEVARPTWTPDGSSTAQSLTNSASPARFTVNADNTTIGGSGLVENNTISGTTGILYAVGAFTGGDKLADTNDTLDVTASFTASSS